MAASAAPRATGRASTASSRRCTALEADETLCVQSGKPVGVFRTHADAPRVLIANSNLVPHWATLDHFNELDRKGLMMYGQMTAGSWIYIGSQGIVQGTYETFVELRPAPLRRQPRGQMDSHRRPRRHGRRAAARRHHGGRVDARDRVPALAHRDAAAHRLSRHAGEGSRRGADHDRARWREKKAVSVGVLGNAAEIYAGAGAARRQARRGHRPDLGARSDQRLSAGRLDARRVAGAARARSERRSRRAAKESMAVHVRAMLDFWRQGVPTLRLRQQYPPDGQGDGRRRMRSISRASCRPISVRCSAAASVRSAGPRCRAIRRTSTRTDAKVKELMPNDTHLHHWLDMARSRIKFQGLPARICWVGLGDRHRLGLAFNEMVAKGELKAPIVIGRDHLGFRLGRQPQPRDRGDEGRLRRGVGLAAAQCAAQLRVAAPPGCRSTTAAASASAISQHAGMVVVCDGTPEAARRIERVLWNDPATGVMRHADAGYEDAIDWAKTAGIEVAESRVAASDHRQPPPPFT